MEFTPIPVERKVFEEDVEKHLMRRMKVLGGECYKWSSKNVRGVPDRICVFPDGTIYLVELKRDKTGRLSTLQKRFFDRMEQLNVSCTAVLRGREEVDAWIEERRLEHVDT